MKYLSSRFSEKVFKWKKDHLVEEELNNGLCISIRFQNGKLNHPCQNEDRRSVTNTGIQLEKRRYYHLIDKEKAVGLGGT